MRLQELLTEAEWERDEMRARRDAEKEQQARAEAADLAERDASFRAWLGEMAEDFEISWPKYNKQYHRTVWSLRPVAWRIHWTISVGRDDMQPNGYTFQLSRSSAYAASPTDSPALSQFLLDAQRAHDAELEKRVASWAKVLMTWRDVGCSDDETRLRDARATLGTLAPERAAEWDVVLEKSLAALAAWRDEKAEQTAVRETAVEQFREAMEAWRDECAAVRAHNQSVIAGLRTDLGDVKQDLMEVEYAVVAADDEYGPSLETRRAWAAGIVAGSDDRTFLVTDRGGFREWTFRNLVGYSEPVTVRPSEHPELFMSAWFDDEQVYYLREKPEHGPLVAVAQRALREFPTESNWSEFGAGLDWGSDVARVVVPARERAGFEQAPF